MADSVVHAVALVKFSRSRKLLLLPVHFIESYSEPPNFVIASRQFLNSLVFVKLSLTINKNSINSL